MTQPALPRWQCHKKVDGDKIAAITDLGTSARLHLACGVSITVDATWLARHRAEVGGYYVVYDDAYASFSPPAAFESGYSLITGASK